MNNEERKFYTVSIRLQPELYHKITYVAQKESRTRNRQIRYALREAVWRYEAENGEIVISGDHK